MVVLVLSNKSFVALNLKILCFVCYSHFMSRYVNKEMSELSIIIVMAHVSHSYTLRFVFHISPAMQFNLKLWAIWLNLWNHTQGYMFLSFTVLTVKNWRDLDEHYSLEYQFFLDTNSTSSLPLFLSRIWSYTHLHLVITLTLCI